MHNQDILDKYFRGDNNPAKRPEVRKKLKERWDAYRNIQIPNFDPDWMVEGYNSEEEYNYYQKSSEEYWNNIEEQYEQNSIRDAISKLEKIRHINIEINKLKPQIKIKHHNNFGMVKCVREDKWVKKCIHKNCKYYPC
jgi:hypothetical protein